MKAILCALLGHAWKRTGVSRRHETVIGVVVWQSEHQCTRCLRRMWE